MSSREGEMCMPKNGGFGYCLRSLYMDNRKFILFILYPPVLPENSSMYNIYVYIYTVRASNPITDCTHTSIEAEGSPGDKEVSRAV